MLFENKWTYISPFINDPNLTQNNPLILNLFVCLCFGFSIGIIILSVYRLNRIFNLDEHNKSTTQTKNSITISPTSINSTIDSNISNLHSNKTKRLNSARNSIITPFKSDSYNTFKKKLQKNANNIQFKILICSLFRGFINFFMFPLILASYEIPDLNNIIIILWLIGQVFFWAQSSLNIHRFFITNIMSINIGKATNTISEIKYMYYLYGIIAIFVIIGQISFGMIIYFPDVENKRLMYTIWSAISGILVLLHCSGILINLYKTNKLLSKSINQTNQTNYQALIKKNKSSMIGLTISGLIGTLIFFIPLIIPIYRIYHDYTILIASIMSAFVLFTSLRYFK